MDGNILESLKLTLKGRLRSIDSVKIRQCPTIFFLIKMFSAILNSFNLQVVDLSLHFDICVNTILSSYGKNIHKHMQSSNVQYFYVHFQAGSKLFLIYVVQPVPTKFMPLEETRNRAMLLKVWAMNNLHLNHRNTHFWPQSRPTKLNSLKVCCLVNTLHA